MRLTRRTCFTYSDGNRILLPLILIKIWGDTLYLYCILLQLCNIVCCCFALLPLLRSIQFSFSLVAFLLLLLCLRVWPNIVVDNVFAKPATCCRSPHDFEKRASHTRSVTNSNTSWHDDDDDTPSLSILLLRLGDDIVWLLVFLVGNHYLFISTYHKCQKCQIDMVWLFHYCYSLLRERLPYVLEEIWNSKLESEMIC
jgi:hypothetical protein